MLRSVASSIPQQAFQVYQDSTGCYECPLPGCLHSEAYPSELMVHLTVQSRHPGLQMRHFSDRLVEFFQEMPRTADGVAAYKPFKHGYIGKPHVHLTEGS